MPNIATVTVTRSGTDLVLVFSDVTSNVFYYRTASTSAQKITNGKRVVISSRWGEFRLQENGATVPLLSITNQYDDVVTIFNVNTGAWDNIVGSSSQVFENKVYLASGESRTYNIVTNDVIAQGSPKNVTVNWSNATSASYNGVSLGGSSGVSVVSVGDGDNSLTFSGNPKSSYILTLDKDRVSELRYQGTDYTNVNTMTITNNGDLVIRGTEAPTITVNTTRTKPPVITNT